MTRITVRPLRLAYTLILCFLAGIWYGFGAVILVGLAVADVELND